MGAYGKEILLEGTLTLRTKELAGGRKSLYLDYLSGGKRKRESLSLYLLPETSVKAKRSNAAVWRKAELLLKERQTALLAAQLTSEEQQAQQGIWLSEWLQRYGEALRRRGVRSTARLKTVRMRLAEYAPDIRLEQIDKPFVAGFVDYLQNGYRMPNGKPLAAITVFATVGVFSSALNYAVSEGLLTVNPYTRFAASERVKPGQEHQREYLTIDELKRMMATPCDHPLVKQVFLFSCFTGLRLSDVQSLRWRDLSRSESGFRIGIRMDKTEKTVYFPLSKQAMKWMPRRGRKRGHERVFGEIPCNHSNLIGQWVRSAGIAKHITHHCGRHTYATMLLTLGVDIYTVSKLLGHTSLRHTQRYAQIVDKKKDDAVNLPDRVFA